VTHATKAEAEAAAWAARLDAPEGLGFRAGLDQAFALWREVAAPGQRWLDVGSGTGELAGRMAAAGSRAVALDLDPGMLAFARRAAPEVAGRGAGGDAARLPFLDASLDGITATSLMGCLGSPSTFLAEAHRALRADAHLIATFTNRLGLPLIAEALATRVLHPRARRYKAFTPAHAARLVEEAGLAVAALRSYNFFVLVAGRAVPRPEGRIAAWARRGGTLLARNFVILARKARG
jgi:ubiquinone/menaquinone biosynthesis C-methylase UbiE